MNVIPMTMRALTVGAVAMVAGCACPLCDKGSCTPEATASATPCAKDSPYGSWAMELPYADTNAGHMNVVRENGKDRAFVLLRWGSPEWTDKVTVKGNTFRIEAHMNSVIEGSVKGDTALCTLKQVSGGKTTFGPKAFVAKRNPPVCPKASSKNVKLGAPVDILKDGLAGFKAMNNATFGWTFRDGVLSNRVKRDANGKRIGSYANIMTKRADFYDFNLEYDVRVPAGANSGVYLRGRYEIQTVDSYGQKVDRHNMAAFYGRITPSVAAEKPAGEWQHVSVTLANRHVTVVLNGTTIIDDQPVDGVTGGAIDANEFVPGPLYIQGDHTDADYRNMILRPVVK